MFSEGAHTPLQRKTNKALKLYDQTKSRALRVAPRAPGVGGAFPRRVEVMRASRVLPAQVLEHSSQRGPPRALGSISALLARHAYGRALRVTLQQLRK